MLWQRGGGLQVQIRETLLALREAGCEARLFDANSERLADYDVVHVFAVINGNERIVEAALDAGLPVVISSVLHPPFNRWDAMRARAATKITRRLSKWQFTTTYELTRRALHIAQRVIALGQAERELLITGYGVHTDRIREIPNGIAERFFSAASQLFRAKTCLTGPFLLHVSSVTPYKNPLSSAKIAARVGLPLVLIGPIARKYQEYLNRCRQEATYGFQYLGALPAESDFLASAYAAASVLLLPSRSEVMPLVVLEALAAGTPAIVTSNTSMQVNGAGPALTVLDPDELDGWVRTVERLFHNPPHRSQCKDIVNHMTWSSVAQKLIALYKDIN